MDKVIFTVKTTLTDGTVKLYKFYHEGAAKGCFDYMIKMKEKRVEEVSMYNSSEENKNMAITRPLNYKGCDPEVEKALRANMAISCYVSDCYGEPSKEIGGVEVEVVAYVQGNTESPYLDSEGCPWLYAVPVRDPVKWIMPPEKAIPILISEGWKFDEYGCLFKKVHSNSVVYLPTSCFRYLGEKLSNAPFNPFNFNHLSCIIEER